MNGARLIVCDDEPSLRRMIIEYLSGRGFNCAEAADAAAMKALVDAQMPDLVLLDIRMPGEDGLSALRSLRAMSDDQPVIMLTAVSDTIDRIIGLELGADDYLAKPVDLRELEARVKAVLRRRSQAASEAAPTEQQNDEIAFGVCRLNLSAARLTDAAGEVVEITAMEFALLRVFALNRGRVLSRDQLLDLAHDRGWEPFDRSIDLRVSRLRRKIEPDPSEPSVIKTVRGIGYMFDGD